MVNSTKHWRPMLNGYSGFRPASYEKSYEAARAFPAQESLIALHERGVTHVIVHRNALGQDRVAQIPNVHELQEIASRRRHRDLSDQDALALVRGRVTSS